MAAAVAVEVVAAVAEAAANPGEAMNPYQPVWRFGVLAVLVICIFVLISLLKLPGLIISAVLAGAAFFVARSQPTETIESVTLVTSIRLSAEEIQGVLAELETFLHSSDPAAIADRTLHHPELVQEDSPIPAVDRFYFEARSARRFLHRLDSHIERCRYSVPQLERLLQVTDERAFSLQEAWLDARRATRALDP